MKDLIIVAATTLIIIFVWAGVETARVAHQSFAPKDLLEISSPISGTIDADYLSTLAR